MRKTIVAGNWKMHGDQHSNAELLQHIKMHHVLYQNIETIVCPPAVYLNQAVAATANGQVRVGAQNLAPQASGAYTGELAAEMLTDIGASHVLVGHSERRTLFGETDEIVAEKFAAAQRAGLTPIFCIGETLEQREQNQTEQVVLDQIAAVVEKVGSAALQQSVIAYEPVWAIGTGRTASPEQAQQVHQAIRHYLKELNPTLADTVSLLYGGSVKPDNSAELIKQADIDGFLVGGASLDANQFHQICLCAVTGN